MSRRERDEQMIKDPNKWPMWPRLPLKKRDGFFMTGILHEDEHYCAGKYRVYNTNLYNSKPLDDVKFAEYTSVEELLNDGWVVD